MKFSASLKNDAGGNQVLLRVGDKEQTIPIAPKSGGGSSVSGGELLFLALATCFCNDIYREAGQRGIHVRSVEVEVEGDFEAAGQPASTIVYRAHVQADADEQTIRDLLVHTDAVAEIQGTVRRETPVRLEL